MHGRVVFAVKPGTPVRPFDTKNWEIRSLPYETYPFTGEININKGRLGAFVFKTKPMAFIIESHELVELFRVLFEMAWLNAKSVDKKKYFE